MHKVHEKMHKLICMKKKSQIAQKEKRNKSEVAFSRLNELRISGMGRWRKIWQDKLNVDSFYELNFLMKK